MTDDESPLRPSVRRRVRHRPSPRQLRAPQAGPEAQLVPAPVDEAPNAAPFQQGVLHVPVPELVQTAALLVAEGGGERRHRLQLLQFLQSRLAMLGKTLNPRTQNPLR